MSPSSSDGPFLSAILRASERADLLPRALEGLCRQTLAQDAFEVVLVHGGSRDGALDVVRSFEARLPLRQSHERGVGLAAAWKDALSLARGEIVLFLDDDAVAAPQLLQAHRDAHRRFPAARYGVLGATEIDPSIAADLLPQVLEEVHHGHATPGHGDVVDFSLFRAGRSSLKRSFVLDADVLDLAIPSGCEDIELAWRLSRRGLELVYDAAAVSRLVRRIGFDDFCRAVHRQGRADLVFSRLHPEANVPRMADVALAPAVWGRVAPVHEALIRSARELDRIVRLRRAAGVAVWDSDVTLLRRGYWATFRALRAKAIVEGCASTPSGEAGAAPL